MVSMNFLALLLFKILTHITADVVKFTKTVQGKLTFIFDVLSEYAIDFVSNAVS